MTVRRTPRGERCVMVGRTTVGTQEDPSGGGQLRLRAAGNGQSPTRLPLALASPSYFVRAMLPIPANRTKRRVDGALRIRWMRTRHNILWLPQRLRTRAIGLAADCFERGRLPGRDSVEHLTHVCILTRS